MSFDFPQLEAFNPSSILVTLPKTEFLDSYEPAYCDDWDEVFCDYMKNSSENLTISKLKRDFLKSHTFNEYPTVMLPHSDLETRSTTDTGFVLNGMHRITVMSQISENITLSVYRDKFVQESFTLLGLYFLERLDKELIDSVVYAWFRSIFLEDGSWAEVITYSVDGDYGLLLYLDKTVDHKLLLKAVHERATVDQVVPLGLCDITVDDTNWNM